jgi:hypothetical protein
MLSLSPFLPHPFFFHMNVPSGGDNPYTDHDHKTVAEVLHVCPPVGPLVGPPVGLHSSLPVTDPASVVVRPVWDGLDLLDELMFCGTNRSTLDEAALMYILRELMDDGLACYANRDIPPRIIETGDLLFGSGSAQLVMGFVLCLIPGSPRLTSLVLQYSHNPMAASKFIEQLACVVTTLVTRASAVGGVDQPHPPVVFSSIHAFVGTCRSLWTDA